ncbi:hypothetical protein AB0L35_06800 [Streptomyces sp. NPDC052309]|uniref:hypothetical protein n=1 Tax=Streptomyces sp. NPDC052309 TaxID=3155421 RepID=UPI003432F4E5
MTPSTARGATPAPGQTRGVRRGLPLLLAALLLPLSACGIPATGVVGAGEPATGVRDPGSTAVPDRAPSAAVPVNSVRLYFVGDGALVAAARPVQVSAEPTSAVLMVFKGPNRREREEGLTTELPRITVAPTIRIDGATVTIELPPELRGLSDTAIDQLACTAAAARLRQDPALGTAQVTVEQPDGRLAGRSSDNCPGLAGTPVGITSPPSSR